MCDTSDFARSQHDEIVLVNFTSCTCLLSISSIFLQDGASSLTVASQNGHTGVVDVLLRHGADPNIASTVSIQV